MKKTLLLLIILLPTCARLAPAQQFINQPTVQSDIPMSGYSLTGALNVSGTGTATFTGGFTGPLAWSNLTGIPGALTILGNTANAASGFAMLGSDGKLDGTGGSVASVDYLGRGLYNSSGTSVANWSGSYFVAPTGLQVGTTSGPTITAGVATPTGAAPAGSLYLQTDIPFGIYARNGGSWQQFYTVPSLGALTVLGNSSGSTSAPSPISMATLKTMLAYTFSSITGTLTKAQQYATTAYADVVNTFLGVQKFNSSAADTLHAGIVINTAGDGYSAVQFQNQGSSYWSFGIRGGLNNLFAIYDNNVNGSVMTITSYSDTVGGLFGFNLGGNTKATEVVEANGNVKGNHFVGRTATPSVSWGTGAGTSPTSTSVTGNDAAGTIAFTTGTSPAASATIATVTFNSAYGAAPHVCLTAKNAASAAAHATVYATTTSTTLVFSASGTALSASTAYSYDYLLIQ